jgi:FkbM family methyltransferase
MDSELLILESNKVSKLKKILKFFLRKFNISVMKNKTHSLQSQNTMHLRRLMELDLQQLSNKFIEFVIRNCQKSYSQLYQDLVVLYITENYLVESNSSKPLTFVEFGACDGIKFSNSYLLEKNNWSGIIAEPARIWHKDLFKNRNCMISTEAVSSVSGESLIFLETKQPEFSSLNSFSQSDFHAKYRKINTLKSYKVESISLNELLMKAGFKNKITYLSLDTEGGEFEILQNFDFEMWSPAIITIEHNYSDMSSEINTFLETKGYMVILEQISKFESWFIHVNQIRIPSSKIL